MRRWSLILLLAIVASVAFAVSFQASQSRGGGGSPQGWTGTRAPKLHWSPRLRQR